jgi:hypothetical protein
LAPVHFQIRHLLYFGALQGLSLLATLIPFLPNRLIPMGTAAKPRSSYRRITHDLSAPYDPAVVRFTNSGEKVPQPISMQLASNFHTATELLAGVTLPTDTDVSETKSLLATAKTDMFALKFDETGPYKQTLLHVT